MAAAFTAYLLHAEVQDRVVSPRTKRTVVVPAGAPIGALGAALVDAFSLRGRDARFSVLSSIGVHEEATFEASGKDFDAEVAMADDVWAEDPTGVDTDSVTAAPGNTPLPHGPLPHEPVADSRVAVPHGPVADLRVAVAGLEVFSGAAMSLVPTSPLLIPAAAKETPAGAVFAPVLLPFRRTEQA